MSCGGNQQPYDFNTDHAGTLSCNRNNCRCGNEQACMYYNRSDQGASHYNYVAVQGSGDPQDPRYKCAYKAYDFYNDQGMYADHALGGLGTYAQAYGEANQKGLYGDVNYEGCSEHEFGKRDMCDSCGKDHPDFAGKASELPFGLPDYIDGDAQFEVGMHAGGVGFDVNVQRWLLLVVVVALLYWMKGRGMLPGMVTKGLNVDVMGYSVMNMLIAVAVLYFGSFFF